MDITHDFLSFGLAELALEVSTNFCNFDSFNIFSADNVRITELSFRDDGVFRAFRLALG